MKTSSDKTIFDGSSSNINTSKIKLKRAIELEKSLGSAIIARISKEISLKNKIIN